MVCMSNVATHYLVCIHPRDFSPFFICLRVPLLLLIAYESTTTSTDYEYRLKQYQFVALELI